MNSIFFILVIFKKLISENRSAKICLFSLKTKTNLEGLEFWNWSVTLLTNYFCGLNYLRESVLIFTPIFKEHSFKKHLFA